MIPLSVILLILSLIFGLRELVPFEGHFQKERAAEQAKLKAQQEESDRLAKELKDKKDAETKAKNELDAANKKALLAPDKAKLEALSIAFEKVQLPELKTNEASEILKNIGILQAKLVNYILEQSEKL